MKLVAIVISYFTITLTISAEISAVRTRSRALYGEYCDNRAIRCDTSLSLTCKNQICVCMKPENMIYDPLRVSCAALAGEKCRFTVMEEYRTWQEEIMCVSNAHCDFTQSVCKCDRDFIELANGTCIPKKNYNETCETASDCKQDLSLICQDSKCTCNPETSEYNDEYQQCVGLANEPCVNDLCTDNAICREESRRTYYSSSESEEEYGETLRDPGSVGRCQCRTAFGVTSDGRCQLGYGGKCNHPQEKCMDWFKCKEGTCVCRYPGHQVYDKNSESCVSYVGGPCTNPEEKSGGQRNKTKIECIEGAICTKTGDISRYQCTCPLGHIENAERGCDLAFGETCTTLTTSYSSRQLSTPSTSFAKCDRIGKLYCIDGCCQCEDDLHVYDQISRSCKGLVGATCNAKQKGECISGSYCQARRGSSSVSGNVDAIVEGICTCQEYYRELEDRTCSPKTQQQPTHITLKSGGSDNGRGVEKFNSTANSIWAIFDHNEDD